MPPTKSPVTQIMFNESGSALEAANRHWKLRAWNTAYSSYFTSDEATNLKPTDLERFGISAYLTGREDEFLEIFERAVDGYCGEDHPPKAARCAFWLGLTLMFRGEFSRGSGWFGRAHGLLNALGQDCVELGYMKLPVVEKNIAAGNAAGALQAAVEAAEIGVRFADTDLIALAQHLQGKIELTSGNLDSGFALLDDVMLSVTGGNLHPIVTGLIYCSVIEDCREVLAFGRAKEWTEALSVWCEEQAELVAFTGRCMIHVAEFRQIEGSWKMSEEQAQLACNMLVGSATEGRAGSAFYRLGEIHRLKGKFKKAEVDFRQASRYGYDPQPGLSLMRSDQGETTQALGALQRALATEKSPPKRIRLLQANVEVMIAAGNPENARIAVREIEAISADYNTEAVQAISAQTNGLVELAVGRADIAYGALRQAAAIWRELGASYNQARAQNLLGRACLELGDRETGELELGAALSIFVELGALPDHVRTKALLQPASMPNNQILTRRQTEILHLIAAGKTNRIIADELNLSERTVDRHVSNILMRLDVPTRAAAIALAYSQGLLSQ